MNMKTLAKLLLLTGSAMCLYAMPGLADGERCRHVGGSILTNILQPGDCVSSPLGLCTDGTATGDLSGAIGVTVLAATGNVLHNHHHWVTGSGDTIFLNDADLTNYPTPDPNRVLSDYTHGIGIAGGTGSFDGATGTVFAFGAADLKLGQIVLRYAGTVCFETVR